MFILFCFFFCYNFLKKIFFFFFVLIPPRGVSPRIKKIIPPPEKSCAALSSLRALSEQLAAYGDLPVYLDFSVVNDLEYYHDLVFRGYVAGAPSCVLSGGRYDRLLQRMGKRGGAIGFAVYLDRLEAVGRPRAEFDADTLICYSSDADALLAVSTAEALRAAGETVRVEAQAPQSLRFRRVLRAEKGAVKEC